MLDIKSAAGDVISMRIHSANGGAGMRYNRPMKSILLALLLAVPLAAQAPSEKWMTVETKHFRIHYPAAFETWTLHLASRMESIHAVVTQEVGYTPKEVVDVLVMDPLSVSNGAALPVLGRARMVLWVTPPEAWSPIGHYRDWAELVFLHEDVHLAHLLRPGRGFLSRLMEHLLPLGPVSMKAPRWVTEGYATYLEGKLTGVGRPNGDFRPAILRKWAIEGRLPSYAQVAADGDSWMGMTMAYLMGSAYMEWLVQRTDPDAWRRVWARLTAKRDRSFDEAFTGVFGDSPAKLYAKFTAELTWKAVELERRMRPDLAEGTLWQDTTWTTGEPAVSPDGKSMAIVLRAKDEPSRLGVWDTRPDPAALKNWNAQKDRLLKNDPQDVPALQSKPFPAKTLFLMPVSAAREPMDPRWMPDGKSILFTSYEPDTDGMMSPDLFLWTPETNAVRRITCGAHVKESDPFPDGRRAAAVQSRFGMSALAEVDLVTGQVRDLTPLSVEQVYGRPRVSPDGKRLVLTEHKDGAWHLILMDPASKSETALQIPEGAVPSFPAWSRDGRTLYASLSASGFMDIYSGDPATGLMSTPVTRTMGAAVAAEPDGTDKGIYFLSLNPDGLQVRHIALDMVPSPTAQVANAREFAPAVRPEPPRAGLFPESGALQPHAYGAGRQEFGLLAGGYASSYSSGLEIGVRGGDVVGRMNYFIAGGTGSDGAPKGGTFALGWRGLPVDVTAQLYRMEQKPSEQRGWSCATPEGCSLWDRSREGVSLELAKQWTLRSNRLGLMAGGLWEKRGQAGEDPHQGRRLSYGELRAGHEHPLGAWEFLADVSVRGVWGQTETGGGWEGWTSDDWKARLGLRKKETSLTIAYERSALYGIPVRETGGVIVGAPLESIMLGGMETTLLPRAARFDTVLDPVFMNAQFMGDHYEGWNARLTIGGLPLFYERQRLWNFPSPRGAWVGAAGLEWDATSGPMAIVNLPGFDITLGAARILDGLFKDDNKYWLGLSWKP